LIAPPEMLELSYLTSTVHLPLMSEAAAPATTTNVMNGIPASLAKLSVMASLPSPNAFEPQSAVSG